MGGRRGKKRTEQKRGWRMEDTKETLQKEWKSEKNIMGEGDLRPRQSNTQSGDRRVNGV